MTVMWARRTDRASACRSAPVRNGSPPPTSHRLPGWRPATGAPTATTAVRRVVLRGRPARTAAVVKSFCVDAGGNPAVAELRSTGP